MMSWRKRENSCRLTHITCITFKKGNRRDVEFRQVHSGSSKEWVASNRKHAIDFSGAETTLRAVT